MLVGVRRLGVAPAGDVQLEHDRVVFVGRVFSCGTRELEFNPTIANKPEYVHVRSGEPGAQAD